MCNLYQMTASVVKVSEVKDNVPFISQVGPDKDIQKLALSNTTLVGQGNVPEMHLLLEGAHYSLVVPRDSMNQRHAAHPEKEDDTVINWEDDGYVAETDDVGDEEDDIASNVPVEDKGHPLFVRTLNLRVAQVFLFCLCPASANNTDIFQVRKYT
jgi:hypothetical protein